MNLLKETRTLGDPSPGFGHPPELPTPDGCPHTVSLRLHVNMKKKWGVVQLVGHLTVNEDGEGSNPSAPANFPLSTRAGIPLPPLVPAHPRYRTLPASLFNARRAGNRQHHWRTPQQPRKRQLRRRNLRLSSDARQLAARRRQLARSQ